MRLCIRFAALLPAVVSAALIGLAPGFGAGPALAQGTGQGTGQGAGQAAGAAQVPALSSGTTSVFLPYLNAPLGAAPLNRPPALGLSFGGPMLRTVMDTGSTGVVVSARSIPDVDKLPSLGPGSLTYTSSGRIMTGTWVVTPVTISGPNGAQVTTRPMPVLAVRAVTCLANARRCRARTNPSGIAMMGVGFARQGDRQAQSTPDHNPFLMLETMGTPEAPGTMRRGYVVTRRGVALGLTPEVASGFSFVKLEKSPQFPDWAAPSACLSLGGRLPPTCGNLLVDTGVAVMYLTLPPAQLDGQTVAGPAGKPVLKPGTPLQLMLGRGGGAPSYSITAGTPAPMAPREIILVPRPPDRTFVNTSVRLLNGFDYLYDADGGFVGFRPRAAAPGGN